MLTAFKLFLRWLMLPALYFGGVVTTFVTIFKKAEWGLLLLIIIIPQPNLWYKIHDYPFGKDFVDILFFSIILGIIVQKKGIRMTPNSVVIIIFTALSYLSLVNSSLRFSLPLPVTTSNFLFVDWKNYTEMILLYFLAVSVFKEEDDQKRAVLLMSVIILFIAVRSYRNFTGGAAFDYTKRYGGPFEAMGLGANHFGAFMADYGALFFGLFLIDKDWRRRLLFLVTVLFCLHPLFYAYSRGASLAALAVVTFFGVVKKRSLLVGVAVVLLAWQTILPVSVVDRISMTETAEGEIESSAAGRLLLWEYAIDLFKENPVFGLGFGGYALSSSGVTLENNETLRQGFDAHNFYMRTLSEQGLVGISVFILLLYRAFLSGWRLYRRGLTRFNMGLGFGFMGTVLALVITNMFGDRWSYFALGGYFWILWGIVDSILLREGKARLAPESSDIRQ